MSEFLDQIKSLSPKRLALLAVELKESLDKVQAAAREPIAVIGIGCRFPGGNSPDAYWTFLQEGGDGVREVPADRWPIDQYFDPDPDAPGKIATRYGGFLDQISGFDANFFGIAPREALVMDPQQRLLLEVSWEALEHAGLAPAKLAAKRVGVFVGICNTDYHQLLLSRGERAIDAYLASGSAFSVAAGRLSYVLGFQGPSMSIDTSCSASLVAIHTACQSLRTGESALALAGGVNVICAPETYVALSRAHMLAPDGRCKTFDAAGDGFGRAEGCGMVVLKRLSDAQRDGDRIIALVRGTAINQDGRSGGLTVPNGPAQESVIRDALAAAQISGEDIDYVEAHGTGTSLGDPIEVRALGRVLGENREANDPLLIGSVKSNFGHLESAAGVAGFIKVALSLQHQQIPRNLHFKNPNQNIDWSSLPVQVVVENRAWPRGARPRRAGVSSFGFSGTNAHAILEEAPVVNEPATALDRPQHCLTLSAGSEAALSELARRYGESMASDANLRLADVAYTAATGRSHLKHRVVAVVGDEAEAKSALATIAAGGADPKIRRGLVAPDSETDVVFLYTGAGAQYPGMGKALYDASPVFRDAIDRCDVLLGADAQGLTLKSVLQATEHAEPAIHNIEWTQPALFAVEYALTELWRSWGIEPAAAIGHSVGEYAAACAAGVFSLEDGLKLIARRGRLLQSVSRGGMMAAVFAPIDEIAAAVAPVAGQVAIAAINAPENVVISGETAPVEALLASFQHKNINAQKLYVSLAAHSPMVDPVLDDMEALARTVSMAAPQIPVAWNLVGGSLPGGAAPDAIYWRRHMREPVRFADGIKALHNDGYRIFLEVGPHPTLLALAQQSLPERGARFLTSLRRGKDDWNELFTSLAELHVHGVPVDWAGVDRPYQRRRVTLPTYPFQRERYWAPSHPPVSRDMLNAGVVPSAEPARAESGDDLFYKVEWEATDGGRPRFPLSSQLKKYAAERFDALAGEYGFSIYDDLMPELDRLSIAYVKNAFLQLGFDNTIGRRLSAVSEGARLGIAEQHTRLFARLLNLLTEDKVLNTIGENYVLAQALAEEDVATQCTDLLDKFSDATSELELLQRCGGQLASVLRGEQDPLSLLFTQGSFAAVRKLYAESPYARTYNGMLAELIREAIGQHDGKPLRVLELGAGTGSTTSFVLPVLGQRVEYTFTDISPFFLAQAKEQFSGYPLLRTAMLDIERDPADQGFKTGGYDIVIAANVLHATSDLRQSIHNVRSLLAPGGLLFLLEGMAPERWVDLTFGLTEGWWRFSDSALRKTYPLIGRATWHDLLSSLDYDDVTMVPDGPQRSRVSDKQALILARAPLAHKSWTLIGDVNGVGADLANRLRDRGDTVRLLRADTMDEGIVAEGELVYLGALELANRKRNDLETVGACKSLACDLPLRWLAQLAKEPRPRRIWLVTRGVQSLGSNTSSPGARWQAPVWGLGRTFALEHADRWGGLIDLPYEDCGQALAEILARALDANDAEDQTAWRDGVRFGARLVPVPAPKEETIQFRPDATYLITGGFGGIGLLLAHWMAVHGARHLALLGRHPDMTSDEVRAIERLGARVIPLEGDVADEATMSTLLSRLAEKSPPLRGIMHAALSLSFAPIEELTQTQVSNMLRVKVDGTVLLERLTKGKQLDFQVFFSSTAAVFGAWRSAHYSAACMFLDATAQTADQQDSRALSIDWGAWDNRAGASAAAGQRRFLRESGFEPISPVEAFNALGRLLAGSASQTIVARVDWNMLKPLLDVGRPRPFLSRIAASSSKVEPDEVLRSDPGPSLVERLGQSAADARRDLLIEFVKGEAAAVLGVRTPELVDPARSLFNFGMDSLMAIELKSRLERGMAVPLPSSLAFNHPTVEALVEFLETILPQHASTGDYSQQNVKDLLDRLPDMPIAEVDSLLAKMLVEEGRRD